MNDLSNNMSLYQQNLYLTNNSQSYYLSTSKMSVKSNYKQIGDLLPNHKDVSLTFEIAQIIKSNQNQMICRIVDEKGIVNAFFNRYIDKLLVGQAYLMHHLRVRVVQHHIQVQMTDKTIIERVPNEFSYKDKANDMSKKSFVDKRQLQYLDKPKANEEKIQQKKQDINKQQAQTKETENKKKSDKRVSFEQKPIIHMAKKQYKLKQQKNQPNYQQQRASSSKRHQAKNEEGQKGNKRNSESSQKYKKYQNKSNRNSKTNSSYQYQSDDYSQERNKYKEQSGNRNQGKNQRQSYNKNQHSNYSGYIEDQKYRYGRNNTSNYNKNNYQNKNNYRNKNFYQNGNNYQSQKRSQQRGNKNFKKGDYFVADRLQRDVYKQRKPTKNNDRKNQQSQHAKKQDYMSVRQTVKLVDQFVNVHVYVDTKNKTVSDNPNDQFLVADESGSIKAEFQKNADLSSDWYYLDNMKVLKTDKEVILKYNQMTELRVDIEPSGKYNLNPVS